MSSPSRKRTASWHPDLPPSLNAVSFNDFNEQENTRKTTAPKTTPYLNLPSRLSQVWINRWTILLLLVLLRVVLLIGQLHNNVSDAKTKALSACSKVEDIGSAMASMPHYLSVGVNDLAANGFEKAVSGMTKGLDLILRGVEGIIVFYINFLTATYVCLITALIHGSLEIAASVTEEAAKAFKKVASEVTGDLKEIAGGLDQAINKMTDGIEKTVFGSIVPHIPKVDFSKPLGKLKDVDIDPKAFAKDIRKLNEDLPDFDQVQELTKTAISIPFDMARKSLNDSYNGFKFDRTVFPVAQKQQLTFCSDNKALNEFFEHIFELLYKARTSFIALLSVLAVAVMAPMAWLEIKSWKRQQKHAKMITRAQLDPIDVIYVSSRPISATWGLKISSWFTGRRQVLARWCVAYATSPPAIFVLSLALAGLFSCLCQSVILMAVEKKTPALARQVGDFAGNVVTSLEKVSENWATDANEVVMDFNDKINKDVLEYIKNATDSVNNTLNVFLGTMGTGLETVFNDTVLLGPVKSLVRCVIGIEIESVQKGLTWVHDHARVDFPLFDNNTFSLGAKSSITGDSDLNTFLSSPATVTTDEVTDAVKHVTKWLHESLVQEVLISTGVLLIYLVVVLLGITRTLICTTTTNGVSPARRSRCDIKYSSSHGSTWETNEKNPK